MKFGDRGIPPGGDLVSAILLEVNTAHSWQAAAFRKSASLRGPLARAIANCILRDSASLWRRFSLSRAAARRSLRWSKRNNRP